MTDQANCPSEQPTPLSAEQIEEIRCVGLTFWCAHNNKSLHETTIDLCDMAFRCAAAEAERDSARLYGQKYIERTDPLISCMNEQEELTCGQCRGCYMQRAQAAESALAAEREAHAETRQERDDWKQSAQTVGEALVDVGPVDYYRMGFAVWREWAKHVIFLQRAQRERAEGKE